MRLPNNKFRVLAPLGDSVDTDEAYSGPIPSVTFTVTETGRVLNLSDVVLDIPSQHFFYGRGPNANGLDVTAYLSPLMKAGYQNFDETAQNDLLYQEQYAAAHGGQLPPAVGSTSTLDLFGQNLANTFTPGPNTGGKVVTTLIIAGAIYLFIIAAKKN